MVILNRKRVPPSIVHTTTNDYDDVGMVVVVVMIKNNDDNNNNNMPLGEFIKIFSLLFCPELNFQQIPVR